MPIEKSAEKSRLQPDVYADISRNREDAVQALYNCLLFLHREAIELGEDILADSIASAALTANTALSSYSLGLRRQH